MKFLLRDGELIEIAYLARSCSHPGDCGVCAGAGVGNRKPFTPTDSILDIIDTEQVQRFLAERQRAEQATASSSTSFVQRNELGDGSSETGMVVSLPEQEDTTELPPGVEFRKI
ncbi:unnamed protein product [Spodoptera littoralis]|uniref:Uncharacterized protein n=1 Tax=Spodoptera littoralis TaxID=7109 RepID=A0A9P0N9Y3_SPOLI|nr:unnamed protein product [Spodoptera littoralis]CAH1646781.1 unnamed protein product [Spodoptera littoralis]